MRKASKAWHQHARRWRRAEQPTHNHAACTRAQAQDDATRACLAAVCVCPISPEVRQWRSTFFLGVAGLRVSSPRRCKRSDRKLPELPVQELAYILPREHGALLAGAARIRVATEAIGPTGGCRAARGGRQLKRAALKGRPRDGDHEAGSSSRWKAPARAHRVLKLQRRGGLAHCCA